MGQTGEDTSSTEQSDGDTASNKKTSDSNNVSQTGSYSTTNKKSISKQRTSSMSCESALWWILGVMGSLSLIGWMFKILADHRERMRRRMCCGFLLPGWLVS